MNRWFCCIAFGVVAVVSPLAASSSQQGLDRRVSIDVAATPPGEVFSSIARALDCRVRVDEATKAASPVSMRLLNVRARVALDAICDGVGCQWQFDGRELAVSLVQASAAAGGRPPVNFQVVRAELARPLPGNLQLANTTIRAALERIGKAAGIAVEIDGPDADRLVSVDVTGLRFLDAVQKITAGSRLSSRVFVGVLIPTAQTKQISLKVRIGAPAR